MSIDHSVQFDLDFGQLQRSENMDTTLAANYLKSPANIKLCDQNLLEELLRFRPS